MKSIKIAAFALGALLCSCSLEEEPYGFMSKNNFYKTEADAESAIANVYGTFGMNDAYGQAYIYALGFSGDDMMCGADTRANDQDYAELGTTSRQYGPQATNQFLSRAFRSAYLASNLSNYVIAYVPNCSMDPKYKNHIIGEAYFIRAWQHFNLVRMFGQVPIRTEPIESGDQIHVPLSPIEDVYTQIVKDLKSAETLLQKVRRVGRVDRWGAQGMLAKVYLTMATSRESNLTGYEFVDVNEAYSEAKKYAALVMDDAQCPYKLETQSLWNIYDIKQRENCERVFCIALDHSGTPGNDFEVSKLPMYWTPALGSGSELTLHTAFGDKLAFKGFSSFCYNQIFISQAEAGDKRISQLVGTKFTNGSSTYEYTPGSNIANFRGPYSIKYLDEEFVGQNHSALIPILRFTDIALIYAEADGGEDTRSYDIMRTVRTRAGLNELPSGMLKQDFRNAVRKERKFEFMGEFERVYDMRRTGSVETSMALAGKVILPGINPYFFPLPAKETEMNGAIQK